MLHNHQGTDGNGIIDTCNKAQDVNEIISFAAIAKPSAIFSSVLRRSCVMDTILLSHPGGNEIQSLVWSFSDGSSATGQQIIHQFPVSTPFAIIKLIVSNANCMDSA